MPVVRTTDLSGLILPEDTVNFDKTSWESGKDLCLTDGRNYSLFEFVEGEGCYGHWFCKDRGSAAKAFAKESLDEVFKEVSVIKGLTPTKNRAAVWMAKILGFTPYRTIETINGPMVLFVMTKDEWSKINE